MEEGSWAGGYSVNGGHHHPHHAGGGSRFGRPGRRPPSRSPVRRRPARSDHEHEHDSGTDENDHLTPDEALALDVRDAPGGRLHHRHHPPPTNGETGGGATDSVSVSVPVPAEVELAVLSRSDPADGSPPRRRLAQPPPPPPPPPPVEVSRSDGPAVYIRHGFGSPYRRPTHAVAAPMGGRPHPHPGHGAASLLPVPLHPGPFHSSGGGRWGGGPRGGGRRWSLPFLLRLCAAACLAAYLAVVVWSKVLLDKIQTSWGSGPDWIGADGGLRPGGGTAAGEGADAEVRSVAAERAAQWRSEERRRAGEKALRRAQGRRERTRPPPASRLGDDAGGALHLARYGFSLLDEGRGALPPPPPSADDGSASDAPLLVPDPSGPAGAKLSPMEAAPAGLLCGDEAKAASGGRPSSFRVRDALHAKSRVLITGILNPIGFHLALALQQRCGVKTVMGIDPMFPNAVLNRLELQSRIAVLTKSIPNLQQPIMLPFVGLDPRLSPKKAAEAAKTGGVTLPGTGELNFLTFKPTHIVHLASAPPEAHRDADAIGEGRGNDNSPYTSGRAPPLFEVRQAAAGMEHLLASVASASPGLRPHLTYASHGGVYSYAAAAASDGAGVPPPSSPGEEDFHPATKLADEVLASSYHALRGVYSVGLRLSDVYGPWGMRGADLYSLTEEAVSRWDGAGDGAGGAAAAAAEPVLGNDDDDQLGGDGGEAGPTRRSPLRELAALRQGSSNERDFLFVDDAVDAIIAAMQYRREGSSPAVFDVKSGERASLLTVADAMESLMPRNADKDGRTVESAPGPGRRAPPPTAPPLAWEHLRWSPRTPLRDGLLATAAWHLHRRWPYGLGGGGAAAAAETGDALLRRHGAAPCAPDDGACLRGRRPLPCSSECAGPPPPASGSGAGAAATMTCSASPFDGVAALAREVTEGCGVVLYTSSLGYNVKQLKLQATVEDQFEDEPEVCNVAFIPRDSALTKKAVAGVPEKAAKDAAGVAEDAPPEELGAERRLEVLNGKILHRGWILIWLANATEPLAHDAANLPKLSPGRLFAPSVKHAMFVDENFSVTPNTDDVLFLSAEMHRVALRERSIVKKDDNGKKHKFLLPAEPERHAILLTNEMKRKKSKDGKSTKKLSVYEAAKFMVLETGGNPSESDPKPLKQQREFYERVPTFVNRDDLRSIYEPTHRYEMRHFIRSRWVLHDLHAEEGRTLRCDWYAEHTHWGNGLDQLSFAHVMARRDIERKFARDEPDDHVRAAMPRYPELEGVSDRGEWHPILRSGEDPNDHVWRMTEKVPEHMFDPEEEEEGEKEVANEDSLDGGDNKNGADMFVRIMSDHVMLLSRKVWGEQQKRKMANADATSK